MATPSVYQRVGNAAVTPSDYDSSVGKVYLRFNGVNQWLQTNSVDFSYSDKMFVCAGVRKLSDAAVGVLLETSPDVTATGYPGAFSVFAPATAGGATYQPYMRGAVGRAYESLASFAAPITNVVSARMFNRLPTNGVAIEATVNGLQQTGAEVNSITTQGNYGNYPLYIGARAGASLFFNGRLYQLVIAAGSEIRVAEEDSDLFLSESGDFITAETTVAVIQSAIEQTEAFVNRKTSAF